MSSTIVHRSAATPPLVWYRFTSNRAGIPPKRELATVTGFLQADA
jgi:hypothetical protein